MKALQAITELFTQLIVDSKNLSIWAEDGALFSTQDDITDGFDLEYTINIMLSEVELQPQTLFMHLVNWLNRYDIDRAEKGLASPTFACELLDKGRADIKIKLDIREEYQLNQDDQGDWRQGDQRFSCESTFMANPYDSLEYFDGATLINRDLEC